MEDGNSKARSSIFHLLSSILDVDRLLRRLLIISFLNELIHDTGIDKRCRVG